MESYDKIYIAGHQGLVGSAILRQLVQQKYSNTIIRSHSQLDLTNQQQVEDFFSSERPQYVFLAAAKVGGIKANNAYPGEFIYNNLMIQSNVIHAAYKHQVQKLLFLGSSCIYPKFAPQPIKEEHLLSGKLEPTNDAYAIAKIAGIKLCQAYNKQFSTSFISIMPTNLYGPNDNFDSETSHVLPALIYKFHKAKINKEHAVKLWGTGTPRREFLYVSDLADACVFLMQNYDESEIINVGTGKDITIKALAEIIRNVVGFDEEIVWDSSSPDGTPRKLLNIEKIEKLGWKPKMDLQSGILQTYQWYCENNS